MNPITLCTLLSRCGCADGYILSSDEYTCQEPPLIYISLGEYIQRFHTYPVSGTDERENIVHQVGANIVALDYFEEMVSLVLVTLLARDRGF